MSISSGQKGEGEAVEADGDEDDAHDFGYYQARLTEAASPLMRLLSSFVSMAVSLKIQPTEADYREILQVGSTLILSRLHVCLLPYDCIAWPVQKHQNRMANGFVVGQQHFIDPSRHAVQEEPKTMACPSRCCLLAPEWAAQQNQQQSIYMHQC